MFRPVPFLRLVALAEAVSYLLLLFIAMPLKYLAHEPRAVMVMGSIHGALFVVFIAALSRVLCANIWSMWRIVLVFVASLLPFLPFLMDRRMRQWSAVSTNVG